MSESECSWVGSTFWRTVPAKRKCSCKMTLMLDRRSPNCRVEISLPSISMCPLLASSILSKQSSRDDFPLPVRPTIPIRSPALTLRVTPFSTSPRSSLYRVEKFTKFIYPARTSHLIIRSPSLSSLFASLLKIVW